MDSVLSETCGGNLPEICIVGLLRKNTQSLNSKILKVVVKSRESKTNISGHCNCEMHKEI